ncbi:MAG: hypothetical protein QF444_06195, partial [Phycisphaerales bacterium]|nr:hypothetical protein [Phycisphaerales bacterium]
MATNTIRNFAKRGDSIPVPNLTQVQGQAYEKLVQRDRNPLEREPIGLEGLLREVFPIESYDGSMRVQYRYYTLEEPRYTPDECKELKLTYGLPFRVGVSFIRDGVAEIIDEEIFLGTIPCM